MVLASLKGVGRMEAERERKGVRWREKEDNRKGMFKMNKKSLKVLFIALNKR